MREMGSMWIMLRVKIYVYIFLISLACSSVIANISYDDKAFIINGKRRILISGSIHYPRSTTEMWPDLIQKAKDGGLDVIQTYVFWNGHETSPGKVQTMRFDPEALERGAKALRKFDSSPHAKKALEVIKSRKKQGSRN